MNISPHLKSQKLLITTQAVDTNHPVLGFFHGWILEFAKHFGEVHVICQLQGDYDFPSHVYVYPMGKEKGSVKLVQLWRLYKYYFHIFRRVHPDYVFYHMGNIYNVLGAPFYFWYRNRTKFYWWKTHGHISFMSRLALYFVDRVYTAIEASFPVKSHKRTVVGHAIDTKLFVPKVKPPDGVRLLFVGRRSRSKRLEQVVAISKEMMSQGIDFELQIIGGISDKEYEKEWQRPLHEDPALAARVKIIDGVRHEQLVSAYQAATIFLNPSDNDGLDKVVLEAMACGTVSLTANRSFATVLDRWGLFMQKGDIVGYVNRIEEILALPPEKYKQLGDELHEYVVANHSLSTITQRIFK